MKLTSVIDWQKKSTQRLNLSALGMVLYTKERTTSPSVAHFIYEINQNVVRYV